MYNYMKDDNSNASNKKAGKGNGNSIISYKSTKNSKNGYTSGDTPSSSSHKLSESSLNQDDN